MTFKREKKEDEDNNGGSYYCSMDKTAILQEARCFNETPFNSRKCTRVLSKILYLINQGENYGTNDATECFFAITKLFQSRDPILRRMVYLGIKDLSKLSEDVIIVTSSLTKDMTGSEDAYRAGAIRAICTIMDASMMQTIERYIKQAIVDRNPSISSAALVSSLHISKISGGDGVIKRWVNEAQEVVSADSVMVQYHALGLLYHIRKNDRLAITKMVSKFTKTSLKSPFAVTLLIRIACKLVEDDEVSQETSLLCINFIESCLRHKSEIVIYEAAHAIVMKKTLTRELMPAIAVLQLFCSSPKAIMRFAAVKTLNQMCLTHPVAVSACNLDLENLITDTNRCIATLAITTLLKTGAESSVDRLMKQIATFLNEISDEFKVVVVEAIRSLCLKFPKKHGIFLNFLSSMLRDEGGVEYKTSIAETIVTLVEENTEAKESGLAHLCEFIEDCEHTALAIRIIHLVGVEGPSTSNPARYIRYIYNRVILENAMVRAAAVTALARFGAVCQDLLPNILILLTRCQIDTDDEVRDRATYFKSILERQMSHLNCQYILNGMKVSLSGLEKALHTYTLSRQACEIPFDIKTVPAEAPPIGVKVETVSQKVTSISRHDMFVDKLAGVPRLAELNMGDLLKSCPAIELTESETEYCVTCIKHIFPRHMVLQFDIANTLDDQLLENINVEMECASNQYEIIGSVGCPAICSNGTGVVYIALRTPYANGDISELPTSFSFSLKFVVKDCDPVTGEPETVEGFADEYVLEDMYISVADYVQKVSKSNFVAAWEGLDPSTELQDTYALGAEVKTLEDAVRSLIKCLGLQPCERSDKILEGKSSHSLMLSGIFGLGIEVLVMAKFALSNGVQMLLKVRSPNSDVAELFINAIH